MRAKHDSLGSTLPRSRAIVRYSVAALLASGAILLPVRWLHSPGANFTVRRQRVLVAARDIAAGVMLGREMLVVTEWPQGTVPVGADSTPTTAIGRLTATPLYKGEPIVPGLLVPAEIAGSGLAPSPGRRAYSVRVIDAAGLVGMVQPNSHVDILVVLGASAGARTAKILMEDVRVLGLTHVDRGADGRPIDATIASLDVTPTEAERLAIAATQGVIRLVLRGYRDSSSSRSSGATTADVTKSLRGRERPRPAAPVPLDHPDSGRAILLLSRPPIYVDPNHRHVNGGMVSPPPRAVVRRDSAQPPP